VTLLTPLETYTIQLQQCQLQPGSFYLQFVLGLQTRRQTEHTT